MNYDRILIRYGELSLKGRNRNFFVKKLRRNVRSALQEFEQIKIETAYGRMFVLLNGAPHEQVIEKLKKVFGIQSFSPALRVDKDLESIYAGALGLVKKTHFPGNTFKVSARRSDKSFEYDSNELNHKVGAHILKNTEDIKVDVRNPNLNIVVEVRHEAAYVSAEVFQGKGGFPAGTSGKAMLMLSGGIDSPVAGYLCMRRGVEIEAVHFHSPPFTSERAKQKVLDLAAKLSLYSDSIKVHLVPFTKVQETIHKEIPEEYTMTTTRRMMLKIADAIRDKRGGLAIATGESLGQVASQTLESMLAINDVTSTPILRPLISMDKIDIVRIAEEIGTIEISNRPYEDCCTVFTPPAPKTKPKLTKVVSLEGQVDWGPLLDEAIAGTETVLINAKINENQDEHADLF